MDNHSVINMDLMSLLAQGKHRIDNIQRNILSVKEGRIGNDRVERGHIMILRERSRGQKPKF